MIHPSPDQVRLTGLAAMVGGALGVLLAPLYSLAYFASSDGVADGEPSWAQQAWAEPARDLLEPADAARFLIFSAVIVLAAVAVIVATRGRFAHGTTSVETP